MRRFDSAIFWAMRRRRPTILMVSTSVLATRAAACRRAAAPRRKASRSSWLMRPAGPLPRTWRRSTPASRARRRTAGEAIGLAIAGRGAQATPLRPPDEARLRRRLGGRRGPSGSTGAGFFGAGCGSAAACLARATTSSLPAPATSSRTSSAPDRQHAADLAAQRDDGAGDRRRHLDRRLVGHHGGEDLVLQHRLADLDMPFDDLGLGDAFADIGQLDDARAHLRPPSRP